MPHSHVSKRERGLFDVCFVMRNSLRTIQLQDKLTAEAVRWSSHIETTGGFWASKKAPDVPLFRVVNERYRKEVRRYPYLPFEGVKNGVDIVCSMLHKILSTTDLRSARISEFRGDSCTEQNKNNIVLAFLLTLAYHCIFEEVNWRFLSVGILSLSLISRYA